MTFTSTRYHVHASKSIYFTMVEVDKYKLKTWTKDKRNTFLFNEEKIPPDAGASNAANPHGPPLDIYNPQSARIYYTHAIPRKLIV